jgi:hypothetical protein
MLNELQATPAADWSLQQRFSNQFHRENEVLRPKT